MSKSVNQVLLKVKNKRIKGNQIFVKGLICPKKMKFVAEDFNIIKGTSKSKLSLYIIDTKLRHLPIPILKDILTNTNGVGKTTIDEGECLAIIIDKPDGRTKLSACISGVSYR